MQEPNLFAKKKYSGGGEGLSVEGWSGTNLVKSSGVVQSGNAYEFTEPTRVNYLRIPFAGTPSPASENSEVICRLNVKSMQGGYFYPFGRYIQGSDPPSWMMAIYSDGSISFVYNNRFAPTTGKITFGKDHKLSLRRQGDFYYVYLDDVEVLALNYPGSRVSNWDWVLGSYLNGANNVITDSYTVAALWKLYEFTAKRI